MIGVLDSKDISIELKLAKDFNEDDRDIVIDSSTSIKRINEQKGLVKELLESKMISEGGTSIQPRLLTPANNKITTSFALGSFKEGENAGITCVCDLREGMELGIKRKISWFRTDKSALIEKKHKLELEDLDLEKSPKSFFTPSEVSKIFVKSEEACQ